MPVGKPKLFLADKGYDGDFLREELLVHGIRPVIPPKANRKDPPACDFKAYKDRNRIERMLNRLKQFRRIATRYDKTRRSFEAFLALPQSNSGCRSFTWGLFRSLFFRAPKNKAGIRGSFDNTNFHMVPKFSAKSRSVAGSPYTDKALTRGFGFENSRATKG